MKSIEWCDETWNPVWGCLNDCPYCYARKIAKRFGKTEDERNFIPTWREAGFNKRFKKSTKRVFVNSMSDVLYWEEEWWLKVLEKITQYPNIDFIFLTKADSYPDLPYPPNVILGYTITRNGQAKNKVWAKDSRRLLNIEPISQPMGLYEALSCVPFYDWLIIGAETGNRKGKPAFHLSWIQAPIAVAVEHKVPVFLKDNIRVFLKDNIRTKYYLDIFRQEYPKSWRNP